MVYSLYMYNIIKLVFYGYNNEHDRLQQIE